MTIPGQVTIREWSSFKVSRPGIARHTALGRTRNRLLYMYTSGGDHRTRSL
jgi:hypothetical protein